MQVQLFADGGIRLTLADGTRGFVTFDKLHRWVTETSRTGAPITVVGELTSRRVAPIVEDISGLDPTAEFHESTDGPAPNGWTSLMIAARDGELDRITDLLERDADRESPADMKSPLTIAAEHGHIDVVRALRARSLPAGDPTVADPPPDASPAVVVLRPTPGNGATIAYAVIPLVIGVVVGLVQGSTRALIAGISIGIVLGLAMAAATWVGGRTAYAFDGDFLWVRRVRRYAGPIDLRTLGAVASIPSRNGLWLFLIQPDAGRSLGHGPIADLSGEESARLRSNPAMRQVPVAGNPMYFYPGMLRHVADYVRDSDIELSPRARAAITAAVLHREPDPT